jgi:hypothetical protein
MRLGTEEWLDGAVRKAGKLFVKDLGRRSRSAARMMGGALSLRGSDTGGRSTALAAFNQRDRLTNRYSIPQTPPCRRRSTHREIIPWSEH